MRQAMNACLLCLVLMFQSALSDNVNEYAIGGSDLDEAALEVHKKMSFNNKDKRRQVQPQQSNGPSVVHHQFPYVQSGGMGGFPAPYNPPSFTQAYNPMGGMNTNNNNPLDRLVSSYFFLIQNLVT